jgi:hypothetical protein
MKRQPLNRIQRNASLLVVMLGLAFASPVPASDLLPVQVGSYPRTSMITPLAVSGARLYGTTSDAYQLAPGMNALPLGITVDAFGKVFASGRAQDASGVEHWIVRKLAP